MQLNFFPLRLRHKRSADKIRPDGAPSFTGNPCKTVNEQILNHSIFIHNKKSIPKSCTSSPWHISDTSECWPMSSQCWICNFKQFG